MPIPRGAPARACTALVLVALLQAGHVLLGSDGSARDHLGSMLFVAVEAGAVALVCARAAVPGSERRTWVLFAAYLAAWSAGDLGSMLHYRNLESAPFPNWTVGAYLLAYGFAYVALMPLLRREVGGTGAMQWLDGLVAGMALASVAAALVFGPIAAASSGSTGAVVATLAYPVADLALLCLLGIVFGVLGWWPSLRWGLLGAGLLVSAAGDAVYCYQDAVGSYSAGSWVNVTWPAGMALMALATWAPASRRHSTAGHSVFAVPATFGLVAVGVLAWGSWQPVNTVASLLAIGAVLAAAARGALMDRENVALLRRAQGEAVTDGLTGLPNRRALVEDLDAALELANGGHPTTLAFFDLDGFKAYNDTFGHVAGDALLARLGAALAETARSHGRAYRLGGDEFCLLLDGEDQDFAVTQRAVAALSEHGDGFAITASCGRVCLPRDARTSTLALQLADERMYQDKDSRRSSPRRQARDLLLQVLREREPELEEHVDDVGTLAVAVGRELGLMGEKLDEVARGAELHDVGKLAVPDTILRKPGPLDDVEWAIMRQHTIVGERILAAAPALRPVARLVRASHERWDGSGYPDGLAGDAIPLGARIIATCDAFDAMRQERPYAPTMSEDDAVAELWRCAGTQFDPAVVEALATVLGQGVGRQLRVA